MATKKKTTIQYSTSGLNSKDAVQNALAAAQYRPSETVTQAADALEQWQSSRPGAYQSQYQGADRRAAGQGAEPENLQLRPRGPDPIYRQYAPELPPERPRRQHGRRGPGGRPDRGLWLQLRHQRRPAGLPAADERAEQHHPHPVQPGAGQLYQRRGSADGSAGRPEPAGTERAGSVPAAAGRLLHPAGAKAGRLRIRPGPGLRPLQRLPVQPGHPVRLLQPGGAGAGSAQAAGIQQCDERAGADRQHRAAGHQRHHGVWVRC